MFKQIGTNQALLREELHHPAYHWPETLLRLPWAGAGDFASAADQTGKQYPVQKDRQGNVCLVTTLGAGAEKTFVFSGIPADSGLRFSEQNGCIQVENANLAFCVYAEGEVLFALKKENVCLTAKLDGQRERNITVLERGGVFVEIQARITLMDSTVCQYTFRLHEKSEFVDFYEEYNQTSAAVLRIEFENPGTDIRFTPDRGREKIDQYLQAGDEIPFMILPYEAPVGWYQTKCAAFGSTQNGLCAGVFIRDGGLWQDYKYALWSSDDEFAVRFRYTGRFAEAEFPVVKSTRYTALAVFSGPPEYVETLYTWHCFYDLNKVKDWVLEWDEEQSRFPVFFSKADFRENTVEKEFVQQDAFFSLLAEFRNLREPEYFDPVCNREMFTIFPVFDALAEEMSPVDFERCRRYIAFLAYSAKDENFMPIENMLAGHPNFLMDGKIPVGIFGAYFPNHPMSAEFIAYTQRAITLNFKYHTRPDVPAWDAYGGRWTENLGCYTFAMLAPLVKGAALIGDDIMLNPYTVRFAEWLLGTLSAPVDGQRSYPPQGAHAGGHLKNPFYPVYHIRLLACILEDYAPQTARQLYAVCGNDAPEWHYPDGTYEVWHKILDWRDCKEVGIQPALCSRKYTGYGCVLRAAVNTPQEISVHIGQIDEGPNYRMGLAGDGGCGVVYYYADGKQYSYNRPEDAGDYMLGDVDNCTNFGVMKNREFRSIGRGELDNPLMNLGKVQWTRFTANPQIQPDYKSKGVLMADCDYIVLYEEVGGMRTKGRLAWFVNIGSRFPNIYQLKPGASPQEKALLPAKNTDIETCGRLAGPYLNAKGVCYDGFGDFLTVVSHKELSAQRTDYGAQVQSPKGVDYIFYDSSRIAYTGHITFFGYIGFVREGKEETVLALIAGEELHYRETTIHTDPGVSVSLSIVRDTAQGMVYAQRPGTLAIHTALGCVYIDGKAYTGWTLEQGYHAIQISDIGPKPAACENIRIYAEREELEICWEPADNADYYEISVETDAGAAQKIVCQTNHGYIRLKEKQAYIQIRSINKAFSGDWSPQQAVCCAERPRVPKGLRAYCRNGRAAVSWGRVQGVRGYILYKNGKEVYRGQDTAVMLDAGAREDIYQVTSFNSRRESKKSRPQKLSPEWDPAPGEGFRRDTRSHEHGYDGFDFINNLKAGVLTYPEDK